MGDLIIYAVGAIICLVAVSGWVKGANEALRDADLEKEDEDE